MKAAGPPAAPTQVTWPTPPLASRTVVLYGDSLAWEASNFFTSTIAAAGITHVMTRTLGGTAICDALPSMQTDAATMHPDAVVVEFSGNAFTPCMRDTSGQPLTGGALYAKYVADAEHVISIFASSGTEVYFAGAPLSLQEAQTHDAYADLFNHMYASLAADNARVRYIDAGAAVLEDGRWTETLPCLADEPCAGRSGTDGRGVNVVRAPDGHHFCPEIPTAVAGVVAACAVWDSGAFRYGTAMAVPIIGGLEQVSAPTGGAADETHAVFALQASPG